MRTLAAEISLKIPDNTADTALATLVRLGIALGAVRRADVWQFTVDERVPADEFLERVARIETIFNVNKHAIALVEAEGPGTGEVWIGEIDESIPADGGELMRQFGEGVTSVRHRTAWRLLDRGQQRAPAAVVRRAAQALLCNPAFQKATLPADAKGLE